MGNGEGPVEERPATWENELVGEAKKLVGQALGADDLAEQGEGQIEVAHEVHEEYEEQHDD
jgi:uncharacterized protein YjbJ (UPF0337 family)